MGWHRKLWGVEFTGSLNGDKPMLLGEPWANSQVLPHYPGEPLRALLFTTRREARAWCRKQKLSYGVNDPVCSQWKFRAVQVIETLDSVQEIVLMRKALIVMGQVSREAK